MKNKRFIPIYIFLFLLTTGTLNERFNSYGGIGGIINYGPYSWSEVWDRMPRGIIISLIFTIIIARLFSQVVKDVDKNKDLELERLDTINRFHSPAQTHECRICGLWVEEYPWGEDGTHPSYQLCPCCGVQFGAEDITPEDIEQYRAGWKKKGYKWYDKAMKPDNWDLNEQLKKAPKSWTTNL